MSPTHLAPKRVALVACALALAACSNSTSFDPAAPNRGPGELVGQENPLNETFSGGTSADTPARTLGDAEIADWRSCGADCQAHCAAQTFNNPLDAAMCPHLWGAGLDTRPVDPNEACRRLHADLAGYFPTLFEAERSCLDRDLGEVALRLIRSEDFVRVAQRHWADELRYDNLTVNFERIYDADDLVARTYRGLVRYDEMVHVLSAHPVLTRRFDNAGDRAEALFTLFLGRPPFDNERADMANLYRLWSNDYFDHPELGIRVPDAFINHSCVDEDGDIDPNTVGQCTSLLWGFNQVVLEPDFRAIGGMTWNENLTPEEWAVLQTPGRILTTRSEAWEHAVAEILEQYLGYDITAQVPGILQPLVEYVFEHGGDIRAAHYAIVTSQIYLQSTTCDDATCGADLNPPTWVYGPLKQSDSQVWIDTLERLGGTDVGACDRRIPDPDDIAEASVYGFDVIANSDWTLTDEDRIDRRYADIARTLGGCPDNLTTTRFKTVSILNTATQEAFVAQLCDFANDSDLRVTTDRVLPEAIQSNRALDDSVADAVLEYQVNTFFGRPSTSEERDMARTGAAACVPQPCEAENFARVLCYALLSSSEMLFY